MPLPTNVQFNIIIYALLAGILIGIMYDFYRIIRGSNVSKIIIAIEDILFWILTAMVVFVFLLYNNYAFLGVYVYVFMIISLFLYLKIISNTIIRFEFKLIQSGERVFRILIKNIIYPFKLLIYAITGRNN